MPKGKNNVETPTSEVSFLWKVFGYVLLVVILLGLLTSTFVTVKAGTRGILMTFGKVEKVLPEGFHWKLPYQTIQSMNVRTQKYYIEKMEGATKDLQDLFVWLSVNYRVSPENAQEAFLRVGTEKNYVPTVIAPAVEQILKAKTVKYEAGEVLDNRDNLRVSVEEELKERLSYYGIEVEFVNIENIDFNPEYREAIERKAVALQNKLAEERELEIRKIKAEQKIAEAQGEAQSLLVKAKAEAEGKIALAEAKAKELELQKEYTTPQLVELKWIEKWDGKLPPYYLGGGGEGISGIIPIINIPTTTGS